MSKKDRRWYILLGKTFGMLCTVAFIWSWVNYFWPGEKFVGSPPSQGLHRNNMDLNFHGAWWGKWGKQFRPHGYLDFFQPSIIAAPLVQYYAGWDVYHDICVEARIVDLIVSDDDGDINMPLWLDPKDVHYSWRKNHPEDEANQRNFVLVEIDDPIRNNFPILPDLGIGDKVKVCGRWVYDRAHDHNEIHPARWVEIEEFAETTNK